MKSKLIVVLLLIVLVVGGYFYLISHDQNLNDNIIKYEYLKVS
jgi:hypothetical protein